MTPKKTSVEQPKPDLSANYRPLGLRAVLAAALMLKTKPPFVKKTA